MSEIIVIEKTELQTLLENMTEHIIKTVKSSTPAKKDNAELLNKALWSSDEVATYLGVSRSTVTRLKLERGFPAPVAIDTIRSDRWRSKDIIRYVERLKQLT